LYTLATITCYIFCIAQLCLNPKKKLSKTLQGRLLIILMSGCSWIFFNVCLGCYFAFIFCDPLVFNAKTMSCSTENSLFMAQLVLSYIGLVTISIIELLNVVLFYNYALSADCHSCSKGGLVMQQITKALIIALSLNKPAQKNYYFVVITINLAISFY